MIIGMPGIGGSLGECQVCGGNFLAETLSGENIQVGKVTGITQEIAVHKTCKKKASGHWQDLPDGPLRKVFSKAHQNEESTE